MSSEYGVSDKRLPWLLRLVFKLALDGVDQERQALKDINAPQIDAFLEYDSFLALTYRAKKVRTIGEYLAGGYANRVKVGGDPYAVEYEFTYLRKRTPIRARLEKRSIDKLFVDLGEGVD